MKRIVILCDGTWNTASAEHPTNVVLLSRALMPVDTDDIPQIPIYVPGVGSGRRGVTGFGRAADRVLGGFMGLGLMENVVEAYLHLVFLYEQGDEIFIFGFSRGAYTARSLTGLIRSTGILDRSRLNLLDEAVARYRVGAEATHPRTEASRRFRLRVSPHVMTSERDRDLYEAHAQDHGLIPPELLRLAYLGVWDTVGALGIPSRFGISRLWNKRFAFHDADLTSLVRAARHAVALDERRREFEPTLWTNIADLNAGHDAEAPPYQERHFPGDHGSVGGGGDIRALSSIALTWMIEGAAREGLAFDGGVLAEFSREQDPFGPLRNRSAPETGLIARLMRRFGRDRPGPGALEDLHPAVLDRWAFEAKDRDWEPYRPGSLRALERQLQGWLDARLVEPGDPASRKA
ncbi:MAG: DUF2235 domain-containing protein [Pseudomonadota bacterium]